MSPSSSAAITRSRLRVWSTRRVDGGLHHRVALLIALGDHLVVGFHRLGALLHRFHGLDRGIQLGPLPRHPAWHPLALTQIRQACPDTVLPSMRA